MNWLNSKGKTKLPNTRVIGKDKTKQPNNLIAKGKRPMSKGKTKQPNEGVIDKSNTKLLKNK